MTIGSGTTRRPAALAAATAAWLVSGATYRSPYPGRDADRWLYTYSRFAPASASGLRRAEMPPGSSFTSVW